MSAIDAATLAKLETPTFLDRLWRTKGAFFALLNAALSLPQPARQPRAWPSVRASR